MAYLSYLQEEDKNKDPNQQQDPLLSSSLGDVVGAGGNAGATDRAPSKSGLWTNLQSYVDANKPQTQDMASKIGGSIQDAFNTYGSSGKLGDSLNAFNDQAKQNTTTLDQGLVNKATNPDTAGSLTDDEKQKYQNYQTANYGGDKDITDNQDFMDATAGLSKANENLNRTGSSEGRSLLLQDNYGRPGYSGGQQKLDQALLGQTPEAQDTFNNLKSQYGGTYDQATADAKNKAIGSVASATGATDAAKTGSTDALQKAIDTYMGSMNDKYSANLAAQQPVYDKLAGEIKNGSLTQQEADQYGIPFLGERNLYGVDPSQYLQKSAAPTLTSSSTPEQAAKYNALLSLINPAGTVHGAPLTPGGEGSYGSPVSYDKGALDKAVSDAYGAQKTDNTTTTTDLGPHPVAGSPGGISGQVPDGVTVAGGYSIGYEDAPMAPDGVHRADVLLKRVPNRPDDYYIRPWNYPNLEQQIADATNYNGQVITNANKAWANPYKNVTLTAFGKNPSGQKAHLT